MGEAIREIARFQTDRGLHKREFDDLNEHTNLIEEILESVGLDVTKENRLKLQERWTDFVSTTEVDGIADRKVAFTEMLENDKVDAYCDLVVYAVGAIMKLGHEPEIALLEASKEINSRVGSMVNGKFEKDLSEEAKANWYKADYNKSKIKGK